MRVLLCLVALFFIFAPANARNYAALDCLDIECNHFSDLEALGDQLSGKRIVFLGEATHGDGTTLKLKARIVKYLHERHGYDVLLFESGAADMFAANHRIANGENVDLALRDALFPIWAATNEIDDLGTVLAATRMDLGGFDMQLSGARPQVLIMKIFHLADDLDIDPDPFRRIASGVALIRQEGRQGLVELDAPRFAADAASACQLLRTSDKSDADVWCYVFENLSYSVDYFKKIIDGGLSDTDFLKREELMASNLQFLTDRYYKDRKVIVWGATSHLMGDRQLLDEFAIDHFESAGEQYVRSRDSKHDLYRIAFSASGGVYGRIFAGEEVPLADAEPGTIEFEATSKMQDAPGAIVFLTPGERTTSRALGHRPTSGDWGSALDAIIVMKEMSPTTMR
ncbi:erythromycin esterase family protein [Erythrobacter sp.]|uniref:erythromycin esterase family protein n=1 Tax=Erythrobacter sp. TaxID=1042 RepID=UPI0025CCB071|nr:erythromycin esterase family protein [Erythrobacter sp.]